MKPTRLQKAEVRYRIVYSTRLRKGTWEVRGPWHPDRRHVEHWARTLVAWEGPVVIEDSEGRRVLVPR